MIEYKLDDASQWLSPLLKQMSDREITGLTRSLARDMRKRTVARIRSQKNPDGSAYPLRLKTKKTHGRVQFIYLDELRDMKSWQDQGDRMTGYDINAGGLRTFIKSKVEKWLPSYSTGQSRDEKSRKKEKMFTKLATARHLKAYGDAHSATVGFFNGRIAQIARIHQEGLRAKVSKNGQEYQYPARVLLGFNDSDLKFLRDQVLEHLSKNTQK